MSVKLSLSISKEDLPKLQAFIEAHPEFGTLVMPSEELKVHSSSENTLGALHEADNWLANREDVEFEPIFGEQEASLGPGYWNDPRGASALTIFCFFRRDEALTRKIDARTDHPLDADDFGRCIELLDSVPEWRKRVYELAAISNAWAALSGNWSAIETSYKSGDTEATSQLIKQLLNGV